MHLHPHLGSHLDSVYCTAMWVCSVACAGEDLGHHEDGASTHMAVDKHGSQEAPPSTSTAAAAAAKVLSSHPLTTTTMTHPLMPHMSVVCPAHSSGKAAGMTSDQPDTAASIQAMVYWLQQAMEQLLQEGRLPQVSLSCMSSLHCCVIMRCVIKGLCCGWM